ncbi:unnamed protein product [Adineta steineri]|uniref:F-box domain-containing protein n=1 Tax=Adineta steineri TaxID=433720 RepID=A0A819GCL5_9BILA|nr:unnamed protein product [Adineta steineri]
MENKKRKLTDMQDEPDTYINHVSDNASSIPLICYQHIFQYLPIESLISVSLTCKTWYNILIANRFCFNKYTKLNLLNENQLMTVSNSKILRHIKQIEIGKYECGLVIPIPTMTFQFHFTSLYLLKLSFTSLSPLFITSLFNCVSHTLQKLILSVKFSSGINIKKELMNPVQSCLCLLSSLHLLPNLIHFFLLVSSSTRIEFDIEKHFQKLTKLQKLIIRLDYYINQRTPMKQLTSIHYLPNLKHLEWLDVVPNDLQILSSIAYLPPLQYIHLQHTLITNEVLHYLSKISTITSIKSDRFSPIQSKLNLIGFNYLLSLKETLKELEISTKDIVYDELMIMQQPTEADCTEDEYEVHLTFEHVNIFKQFIHLTTLSLNKIRISIKDIDDLLSSMAYHNKLKILNLESVCFPSFTILSTMISLEELSLSYPYNRHQEEYTDKDLFKLYSLKNLKVLILYHSINLTKMTRQQLKRNDNLIFEHLDEFIYNDDDEDKEDCDG